jgi:hypothetical protein
MPARGETSDFPSHGFQVFYFLGAPLALREVLLASQGIGRVQFVVEKSMEGELPFRTVAELTHAAIGRLDIGNVHEITEGDLQLVPLIEGNFAESRLCQLHLSPRSGAAEFFPRQPVIWSALAPHNRLTVL